MTKAEWDALSRRTQLRVLDHMRASTTHAWTLTDDQLERVLNGFFEALDCSSAEPCAACRLEWTKPAGARSASVPPEPPTLKEKVRAMFDFLDMAPEAIRECNAALSSICETLGLDYHSTEISDIPAEVRALRAELADARAVIEAARRMPRATPGPGGAATVHQFNLSAADVWALDRALTTYDRAARAVSGPQQKEDSNG